MKRMGISLLLIVLLGVIVLLYNKQDRVYEKNLFYMDTYINIKVYTNKKEKYVKDVFDDLDKLYSTYHKLSDAYNSYDDLKNVYYLNEELEDGVSIEIDERLSKMISYGLSYYDKSDGYFNIALGNVTRIWKEYRDNGKEVPSYELLSSSLSTNPNDIVLDLNNYTKYNGVRIDLGALSKGYATEESGKYLEEKSLNKYIINAGGNVKVGKSYDKDLYQIGLEDPNNKGDIYKIIDVENKSIVTSGNYQRYYEVNGTRYSHIINPKTLYPDSTIASLTVVTDNSAYADIMSTYLYLLDEDKIKEVVLNNKLRVIYYTLDGRIVSYEEE